MSAPAHISPSIKPVLPPLRIGDPVLAATLELVYLRPFFESLPAEKRSAVDIGAHRGEVTGELLAQGFRVIAVEPQGWLADRLSQRFAAEIESGQFVLERCAASDKQGTAILHVGSASTISSLEEDWTTVAFPEFFQSPTRVEVPLLPAGELMRRHGMKHASFAKIDVEGHELPALRGLLAGAIAAEPPAAIMFEASHAFPEQAEACLKFLASNGYTKFDLFIRWGVDPVAAERSLSAELPDAWRACEGRNFYANFVAYHASASTIAENSDPIAFIRQYQMLKSIDLLRSLPVTPGVPNGRRATMASLREDILSGDWTAFPQHKLSRHIAFSPAPAEQPGQSTAASRIVEVGAGFGQRALEAVRANPQLAYTIVDLPERLAVQHFHLTLSAPRMVVRVADRLNDRPTPGEVLLVPPGLASAATFKNADVRPGQGWGDLPTDLLELAESAVVCGAD
ncbi:FkbM family methyltransferase [Humisphaera borealis]|uniref:FkbM family methyltransferase n=1 Tax=Humisphaera borealis TaxID=2807512 RepID=A0A7M2WVI1_9BACT|nr:FkbM family methyltransferase [Humisphaera borealis]QOV89433.1 FkbM family methyltransferase [Humisphaera borealis]